MMRACVWLAVVMMPDWLPVRLTASSPLARIASARSDIEMRSPADRSMSSSRGSGLDDTDFACARSASVVSPIADTTTTTRAPERFFATTRSATRASFSGVATELPPYF